MPGGPKGWPPTWLSLSRRSQEFFVYSFGLIASSLTPLLPKGKRCSSLFPPLFPHFFTPFSPPWSPWKRSVQCVWILPPVDRWVCGLGWQCFQGLTGDGDTYVWGCWGDWATVAITKINICSTYIIWHLLVLHAYPQSSGLPTRQDYCHQLTDEETEA